MIDEPKKQPVDLGLDYAAAMHGVQTGVMHEMNRGGVAATPKHLLVGVESSQINAAALASLLIEKGIITSEEYSEAIRLWANNELYLYEQRANSNGGPRITMR